VTDLLRQPPEAIRRVQDATLVRMLGRAAGRHAGHPQRLRQFGTHHVLAPGGIHQMRQRIVAWRKLGRGKPHRGDIGAFSGLQSADRSIEAERTRLPRYQSSGNQHRWV